jgi:hypothetical protein
LKQWLDEHPDVRLDGLAYHGAYPVTVAGIPDTPLPPPDPTPETRDLAWPIDKPGPQPGWYALSLNYLRDRSTTYRYFLTFQPAAMAGYSIWIYNLTPGEPGLENVTVYADLNGNHAFDPGERLL